MVRQLAEPVRIDVRGHIARCDSKWLPLIGPAIELPTRTFSSGASGVLEHEGIDCLYEVDADAVWMPAGLVPRIVGHIEASGRRADVVDRTRWHALLNKNSANLSDHQLTRDDIGIVRLLSTHPRGQFAISNQGQLVNVLATIGNLFEQSRLLIVTANLDQAKSIERHWGRNALRPITSVLDVAWQMPCWALICTSSLLPKIKPDDWEIVVFADHRAALAQQSFETAMKMTNALRYCVRDESRKLDHAASMGLEALVGPELYRSNAQHEPSVRVLIAKPPHTTVRRDDHPLERKRKSIWHNVERNRFIARIAQAFAQEDLKSLWKDGLLLHDSENVCAMKNNVVVLVETHEHARAIASILPAWQYGQQRGSVELDTDWWKPTRVILTMLDAHREGINADIVIRADGTGSDLELAPNSDGAQRHVIVIDVDDDVDRQAQQDTARRQRRYRSQGWAVTP